MTLSRRALMAWLAGAPLVAGCRPRPIPGSIRGASMPVGHRLRETAARATGDHARRVRVAIVGGGPSGLCAAWHLERLGISDFVVLDLEPQPGGTSAFGTDGIVPYPWGAHYVPVPSKDNLALGNLLKEMGVLAETPSGLEARETARIRAPEERVFADGRWQEGLLPESKMGPREHDELQRFESEVKHWSRYRDAKGRPAFALPVSRCSLAEEPLALDRISADAWLTRLGISSPTILWYLEYACRDDYGLSLRETSAWALLFYFASRREGGGESAPFLTWPEGNGRLVQHLTSVVGSRLQTGRLVTDVVPEDDGVALSVFDVAQGSLRALRAERVILALPKFVVARVLRPYREQPPAFLKEFSYGAWLVANLHLSGRPQGSGFEPAWDNVLFDSASLGYVVATHQRLKDLGRSIWTYYLPLVDADPAVARRRLAETTHGEFSRSIVDDLSRAHPGLERYVERIDVWRWGHAMVRPRVGFFSSAARTRAAAPFARVHFAHSDLSGVALFEEAQAQGVRAAEEVAVALGAQPT
ncbi:MAG: FAD-dependent oxidoreductase [Polyangiaceae bacterium]